MIKFVNNDKFFFKPRRFYSLGISNFVWRYDGAFCTPYDGANACMYMNYFKNLENVFFHLYAANCTSYVTVFDFICSYSYAKKCIWYFLILNTSTVPYFSNIGQFFIFFWHLVNLLLKGMLIKKLVIYKDLNDS